MTEVTIVSSWWDWDDNHSETIVAVYADRAAAEAFVTNQQQHAQTDQRSCSVGPRWFLRDCRQRASSREQHSGRLVVARR